jgi:CDP-glycerol glycerophosphotransferase (TagB/SpsB family)
VPGFTFARGNTAKLLSAPLYAAGILASVVVPRRRTSWVFGCGSGLGEGAIALFQVARVSDPSLDLLWLARDDRELRAATRLGIRSVLRSSGRGLWATLRARVVVVTHGLGDANRFGVRGAFVVQLWHGIPLKKIQLDSPVTFGGAMPSVMRRLYRRSTAAYRLVPTASELSASRLRSAFGLTADRVVVTGDPRDDILSQGTERSRIETARALLESTVGPLADAGVILYAPTWRDGERDPGVPSSEEWRLIDEYLAATNRVLVLRPHPHGIGDYGAGPRISDRIRMLAATDQNDVTPVLPAVELLITDYSSIAYDFALTSRPIAFLAPDVERYTATRGLYEPYEEFSAGTELGSWTELIGMLGRAESEPGILARLGQNSRALAEAHHAFRDGRNTERVYGEIIARLGEHS